MFLPPNLQHSIECILEELDSQSLKSSSARISKRYRQGCSLFDRNELITYLIVRMPATYAAISTVLCEIPFPITSLLDLGSGPGTGYFAAQGHWRGLKATCLERESTFIELGKRLGCAPYRLGDVAHIPSFEPHDLALFGYSFGEFPTLNLKPIWEAVSCVVIVEPGTPRGFQNVLAARKQLVELGGSVLAPCPHSQTCPHPTWCHFSVRIGRSFSHRLAKEALLPYEDEKFSYCIVTKEPLNQKIPRILSHPERHGGHLRLELCTLNGIEKRLVSKKEGALYKQARKAHWGDCLSVNDAERL